MELKNFFAQDDQGNSLGEATCYLYARGTENLAAGLQAANGTALANPFTADATGLIQFAAPNGLYDLRVVKGARDYRVRVQCLDVEESVAEAEAAAGRAEVARDAAQLSAGVFADTAAGLAGTASGGYFSVPSATDDEYLILYKNNAGSALEVKRYPGTSAVAAAMNVGERTRNRVPALKRLPLGPAGRRFAVVMGNRVVLGFDSDGRLLTDHTHTNFAALGHTHKGLENPPKRLPRDSLDLRWGVAIGDRLALYLDGDGKFHSDHKHIDLDERLALVEATAQVQTTYVAEVVGEAPQRTGYLNELDTARRYQLPGTDVHDIVLVGGAATYQSTEGYRYVPLDNPTAARPVLPSGRLVFCGDSLTVSWGGNTPPPGSYGENWPISVVAPALGLVSGVDLFNLAESGSASSDIALKLGAIQPVVTVSGDTIPSSGAVTAYVAEPTTGFRAGAGYAFSGVLAGVAGWLAHDGAGNWTFTRDAAGDSVVVPTGSTFVSSKAELHENDVVVFWAGRNNLTTDTFADDVVRDAQAVEAFLNPLVKRLLVVSVTNGQWEGYGDASYDKIIACNARLADEFGARFVDVRSHLFEHGLAEAGITPTQDDLDKIAIGRMPVSLMRDGSDSIHFNPAAYAVIGNYIIDAGLVANGWFNRI